MSDVTSITCWITGANGQLGRCLRDALQSRSNFNAVFSSRDDLDLTEESSVRRWLAIHQPQIVINTVAYTAVDRAEDEAEAARLANITIPEVLAEVCASKHIPLIHVSTDYVFNGESERPYAESDPVSPNSVYGKTKLAGEQVVLEASEVHIVVRTAWLYSEYGHNFVKTMLRLGAEKESIKVVNDQTGSPTYARDLAEALLTICESAISNRRGNYGGIYHFTNSGTATWYDLASEVMALRKLRCEVAPCSTSEFPTKARRPAYSVLDTQKIRTTFGFEIPDWKDALRRALSKISTP